MSMLSRIRRTMAVVSSVFEEYLFHRESFPARLLRRLVLLISSFLDDRCLLRASALSFVTLLSIVPLLAAIMLMFKAFGTGEQSAFIIERIQHLINRIVPQSVLVSGGERMAPLIASKLHEFASRMSASRVGGIGIAFLLLTAISLLRMLEKSLNDIWGIRRPRHLIHRIVVYWAVISLGPILLLTAFSSMIFVHSQAAIAWLASSIPIENVSKLVQSRLLPVIILTFALMLLYKLMPQMRVRWKSSFYGGVIAAVLLVAAVDAFSFALVFTGKAAYYTFIYGAIAIVPLILIFVYAGWAVVLFGAEISFSDQNAESYFQQRTNSEVSILSKQRAALRIVAEAVSRFVRDESPASSEEISRRFRLPPRVLNDIVTELEEGGILAEVDGEGGRYVPMHNPAHITVDAVLNALIGRGEAIDFPDDEIGRVVDKTLDGFGFRDVNFEELVAAGKMEEG